MDACDTPLIIKPGDPSPAAVYAPSSVYLTGEEWLRVTSFGNAAGVTLGVTGRILRPDNVPVPIAEAHAPNSNRTVNQTRHPLSEGWLLGLGVLATAGTPAFGQVWVCVELVRGGGASAQVVQALAMGFCTTRTPLIWPGNANLLPLDGPGNLRSITGTTPGAGAEVSETVPTGARWELLAFRAQLVTSATVANRSPQLVLDDGANIFSVSETIFAQAASLTLRYDWFQGATLTGTVQGLDVPVPLQIANRLGAGFRIRTLTQNIQAGDQLSAVQYLVREWLTGE
jgi:hypothetical protein